VTLIDRSFFDPFELLPSPHATVYDQGPALAVSTTVASSA
jgi:hypothetical protein